MAMTAAPPRLHARTVLKAGRWSTAWLGVILLGAAQGYLFATLQGRPQPWLGTLGYVFATVSIWILLSPIITGAARAINRGVTHRGARFGIYAAGLPLALVLHAAVFAMLFYPVYGGRPGELTRLEMGWRSLIANLNISVAIYFGLVLTRLWGKWDPEPASPASQHLPSLPVVLRARRGSREHIIQLSDVDWIGAAGDYAEVHTSADVLLIDQPLSLLAEALPACEFSRVHRGTIVRLDRIREMKSMGRGDAILLLRDGSELRLSRRFRAELLGRLRTPVPLSGSAVPPGDQHLTQP